METFLEQCCSKCWHTADNPCPDFIDCCREGPKCHDSASCVEEVLKLGRRARWQETAVPKIVIGMGTCGLAAGAQKIKEAVVAELAQRGVKADIVGTACIGQCQHEVLLDVIRPGRPCVL